VVVDRPEVERGAVAGEIAGVRRRRRPAAAQQWHVEHEGIERDGRVGVEVAEENLPVTGLDADGSGRSALGVETCHDAPGGSGCLHRRQRLAVETTQGALSEGPYHHHRGSAQHEDDDEHGSHRILPPGT